MVERKNNILKSIVGHMTRTTNKDFFIKDPSEQSSKKEATYIHIESIYWTALRSISST